jgi:hypothetical protein
MEYKEAGAGCQQPNGPDSAAALAAREKEIVPQPETGYVLEPGEDSRIELPSGMNATYDDRSDRYDDAVYEPE